MVAPDFNVAGRNVALTKGRAEMPFHISTDQFFALLLAPFVLIVLAVLYLLVVPLQGRPFIFASERMKSRQESFYLFKIRTMHPPVGIVEEEALGGHLLDRVTPVGAILRKLRVDELPQILNVLRGDIRFIGPRPQLRKYVESYPELFDEVLKDVSPGITGLATVMFHRREECLLSACRSAADTDRVYRTRCIPRKARLDKIYRDRRCLRLNLWILWQTVARLSLPDREGGSSEVISPPYVYAAE